MRENVEISEDASSPKKNIKETWAGLEPRTQLWLKISGSIVAVLLIFAGGYVTGYEKAKIDFANAIEDAFEDAFSDF